MQNRLFIGLLVVLIIAGLGSLAQAQKEGYVYVSDAGINDIYAYQVNGLTGALTAVSGSPFTSWRAPWGSAVDPTGRFLYVAGRGDAYIAGELEWYKINASSGVLSGWQQMKLGSNMPGNEPYSVVVDPTGRFLYISYYDNGSVIGAFSIKCGNGTLTPIPGQPFATGPNPMSLIIDPTGRFLYSANSASCLFCTGSITGYAIDQGTGALTQIPGSPFVSGQLPWTLAMDNRGQFLYAANSIAGNVLGFQIDNTTGALTQVPGSPFTVGINPQGIAVDPTGNFVYVSNIGEFGFPDNRVFGFQINRGSGTLTPVTGSPFTTDYGPSGVGFDSAGKFVFVAAPGTGRVWEFQVDTNPNSTTYGTLKSVSGSPIGGLTAPEFFSPFSSPGWPTPQAWRTAGYCK